MNAPQGLLTTLRKLILVSACAMTATLPSLRAQTAPTPPVDPATLQRYDKNHNGVLDPDEAAAMNADQQRASGAVVTTAPTEPPKPEADTVVMSPFEVVSDTRGYYSANTMSGTRFNTKLDDLATSMTVVTKEQMQDFAMLDINDVFLYTASTEGTGTFTDVTVDRNGSVSDNVQLNPANANRIRGVAPANISFGNMETMNRTPIDPIVIDAIEISRGPNANVFGLGNPSGTVNLVPTTANITRDRTQSQLRADTWGGFRTTLDINRVLIKNKLAVRLSGVYQRDSSTRKPTGLDSERYNAMIKYQPFKGTTITASMLYYHAYGNRPNAITPRDNITYWLQSGKPTWDPVTETIHVNGQSIGPITTTTFPTTTFKGSNVDYFSASLLGATHNQMFIDGNGNLAYWSAPQTFAPTSIAPGAIALGPVNGGQAIRYVQTTGYPGTSGTAVKPAAQPLFATTPGVSSKSIYDWSSINLAAPNWVMDKSITSTVTLDQVFLNTPMHQIAAQGAFMREDSQRYTRNVIGIANDNGQSGQLEIDPNERNLDGSPNPFFLEPFIGTDKPRTTYAPWKWDTYRAQLAYRIDLTHEKSWMKWLGMHQFTGYDEYKYRIQRTYSFRDVIYDQKPWLAPGTYLANQAQVAFTPAVVPLTQGFYRYYVGDNSGNNVDFAPKQFKYGTYPFTWGTYTLASGVPVASSANFHTDQSQLAEAASTDGTGGNNNIKTILKTAGVVTQSHFFEDALVITLGKREDKLYQKFGNQNTMQLNADGRTFNYPLVNSWVAGDYRFNSGMTSNVQFVGRPFRDLPFIRSMDESTGLQHFLGNALKGISFNFNKSNSFLPATPAQDLFLNPLPNPTGTDKSYGISLNMFDSKLVLRITHYETAQLNTRNGDANTIAQRVIRTDLPLIATTPAKFMLYAVAGSTVANQGPNSNQFGWIKATNPTWTDAQVQAELSKEMGLSTDLMNALINPNPPIAATNDILARGTEVELNFNPTPWWTLVAAGSDTQAFTKNVSSAVQRWIDQRMPIWTTIKDPTIDPTVEPAQLWWNHNYGGTQTAAQNFLVFVAQPYSVIKQLEGQVDPQNRRYAARISSTVRLSGLTTNHFLKNFALSGAIRWEDKAAIGFLGRQQPPAVVTDLDVTKPIWDKAHTFLDAGISYRTKMWHDKIGATYQINVRNLTEGGSLQPIAAYPDGTPNTFRIVDPRQIIFTASFDL